MRAFIVLCLVAVACADKLGYNYQPVGHSNSGLSFAPGSGISGGLGSGLGGGLGGSLGSGLGGGNSGFGGNDNSYAAGPTSYDAPAEYNKEFFSFTAPEGEFDDADAARKIAGSLKKNLRVVFIKNPENKGYENAVLALAKKAAEQKTAIYVLNKQHDIGDLANKFNALNRNNNNKPEVHFVKYRTPEDAANAQRQIQSQYNSYGGPSQSYNGGVAPVINFASQAPRRTQSVHNPDSSYLPASIFRRRI